MRVALLAMHTCPLALPGERDAGGMNVYVRSLARELGNQGIAVDIFTRAHGDDHHIVEEAGPNARVIHIPAGPADATKEGLAQYTGLFASRILAFGAQDGVAYSAVHAHYWLSGVAGLRLREAWGTPLVATFHTLGDIKLQSRAGQEESAERIAWERRICMEADALMVSTAHEQQAIHELYGVPLARIATIAPGVDLGLFRPINPPRAQEAIDMVGKRLLLFVGRLDPLKGVDLALEAMAYLDDREVELAVVGGEQDGKHVMERLRRLVGGFGLKGRVHFTGPVPHERLPQYYSAAEALVMPSYYESFGLVALEAMACGTPVVAARVGGLASLVQDGETGFLVPWHCPEPFANRLEVLLSHPDLRDAMGRAARARAQLRGWPLVARETAALYTGVVNASRSAASRA
jgi:D-inositol-3-phosphate glycosyltransferase